MAPLADPLDAGLALARALAAHDIALGGALAYGIWGIPRATLDVDINVFLEEPELMMGEHDERVARRDALVAACASRTSAAADTVGGVQPTCSVMWMSSID